MATSTNCKCWGAVVVEPKKQRGRRRPQLVQHCDRQKAVGQLLGRPMVVNCRSGAQLQMQWAARQTGEVAGQEVETMMRRSMSHCLQPQLVVRAGQPHQMLQQAVE